MADTATTHIPVLTNRVLEYLAPGEGKVYIDCTLGLGGHTEALLKALNGTGHVYGIEVDERNLTFAQNRLKNFTNVTFTRDSFQNLEEMASEDPKKWGHVDGILFDLGLSSPHVDDPSRGFSFQKDGPLDMRFDTRQRRTAADIINTYSLKDLLEIFNTYGQERFSYRIATQILEQRRKQKFTTTSQLAEFISSVVPSHFRNFKIHPATRIFQALRIATNEELLALQHGLLGVLKVLSPGGRVVVISYHSLEDRIVKNFFREMAKQGVLKIITKRPVVPYEDEQRINPRSRSAKLRVAELI